MRADLERLKDDDEAAKRYGVEACARIARALLDAQAAASLSGGGGGAGGCVRALHFITLNVMTETTRILSAVGLAPGAAAAAISFRDASPGVGADGDDGAIADLARGARPIFGANRAAARDEMADSFPNGAACPGPAGANWCCRR